MLMRAISVRQPWAWLLLHKGKNVENRSWALPACYVGVPLLLHAGKTEASVPPEMHPLLTEYDGRLGGRSGTDHLRSHHARAPFPLGGTRGAPLARPAGAASAVLRLPRAAGHFQGGLPLSP